jgi:hypothetical protein
VSHVAVLFVAANEPAAQGVHADDCRNGVAYWIVSFVLRAKKQQKRTLCEQSLPTAAVAEKRPALHNWHADCPRAVPTEPAPHALHCFAPSKEAKLPTAHLTHAVAPTIGEYLPAVHGTQAVALPPL